MKKTLTLMALLSATSLAMGETVIKQDFTSNGSADLDGVTTGIADKAAMDAAGWTMKGWQNWSVNSVTYTENGIGVGNWNQGIFYKTIDISTLTDPTVTYVIDYVSVSTGTNYNNVLALSSSDFSLAIGRSYDGSPYHVGTGSGNAFGSANGTSFQKNDLVALEPFSTSGQTPVANTTTTCHIELQGQNMTVSFRGAGGNVITYVYSLDALHSFTQIGFAVDNSISKTKSLVVEKVAAGAKEASLVQGSSTNWAGSDWKGAYTDLNVTVTSEGSTGDKATLNIGKDNGYKHISVGNLSVSGGGLEFAVASGAELSVGTATVETGSKLVYSGAGKVSLGYGMTITDDYSAISGITGTLEITGANTLQVGISGSGDTGKDQGFGGLNVAKMVLTDGATFNFTGHHTFTNEFEINGGTLQARDGLNMNSGIDGGIAYTFSKKITVNGTNNVLLSNWDKHFALNGGIEGSGALTIRAQSNGNSIFDVNSAISNEGGITLDNRVTLNLNAGGSIAGPVTMSGTNTVLNVNTDASVNLAGSSNGTVNVAAGKTLSGVSYDGNRAIKYTGAGTVQIDVTGHSYITTESAFAGTLAFNVSSGVSVHVNSTGRFTAVNGTYAGIDLSGQGNFVIRENAFNTKETALHIGNLSGTGGHITGTYGSNNADQPYRYLAVHQTADKEFAGDFANNGIRSIALIKLGGSNLTLSANNGSEAGLYVEEGTLTFKGDGAWGGAIEVGSKGTLAYNGTGKTIAADANITFAPATPAVEADGTNPAVPATPGATLAVVGGDLTVAKDLTIANVTVAENAQLTITGTLANTAGKALTLTGTAILSGTGSLHNSVNTITISALDDSISPALSGDGEGSGTSASGTTVSNITITDEKLAGTGSDTATISNALIILGSGASAKALSGVTLEDSNIVNVSGEQLVLEDVVYSGTVGVASDKTALTLDATNTTLDTVVTTDGVNSLNINFTDETILLKLDGELAVTLASDLMLQLQAAGYNKPLSILTISFGDGTLEDGMDVSVAAADGFFTLNTLSVKDSVVTLAAEPYHIPEPATATLSLLALAALAARRRRKH